MSDLLKGIYSKKIAIQKLHLDKTFEEFYSMADQTVINLMQNNPIEKITELIDCVFKFKNKIIELYPKYKDWFLKTLSIKLFELSSYYAEILGYVVQAKKYFNNAFQITNPEDIADSLIELYTKSTEENPMPFYEKFCYLSQYDGIDSDISDNDAFRTELEFNIGIIHQHLDKITEKLSPKDTQDLIQNLNDITLKLEQYYNNLAKRLMSENFELSLKYFKRAKNYTTKLHDVESQIPTPNKLSDPTDITKNEPPISLELLELVDPSVQIPELPIKLGNSPTESPEEKELAVPQISATDTEHKNTRKTRSLSI